MKEMFSQKNFNYIFILLFCFYICLPPILFSLRYIIIFDNNIYLFFKNIINSWHPLNIEIEIKSFSLGANVIESNHFSFYFHFFSISSIILFFLGLKKLFINQKIAVDNSTILAIKILTLFCGIFLMKDILNLILNYLSDDPITNRKALYDAFLDKRLTYVNVFLINIICLYFFDRKWFYIGAILIFVFDVLSLSRVELFYLAIIYSILNIKFDFKNLKYAFFFIFFLICIVFYRSIINDERIIHAFLWEPYSIYLSTLNFWENFFNYNYSLNYMFYENDTLIKQNFVLENWNYFLKNLFYINNEIINYDKSELFPKVSSRGINSIIPYSLFFVLLISVLLFLKKIYKLIDGNYFNIVLLYSFFSIFRGNTVHTLAFCVKLLILTLIIIWIIKIIKLLNLKVG